MGTEWRTSTWGEEVSLEYGKALRTHNEIEGRYRVFGANGPIGWTSAPLVQGPGVVLGRKGAYRGVQYSSKPFFVIDTAYYVVPKRELDMRWLYYAIKHYKLGEVDDGSPIPSTTRSAVYMLDLRVPPLKQQRAIAHILGTLDDKIELNRRMNETMEAMVRALFKSWFVAFDPVRAKAEARDAGAPRPLYFVFPDFLYEFYVWIISYGF
jgi:type I restriction enzyme S subunit